MGIRLLVVQIRDDLTNFGGANSHDQFPLLGDLFHPVSMIGIILCHGFFQAVIEIILYHFFQAVPSDVPMFHDLIMGIYGDVRAAGRDPVAL